MTANAFKNILSAAALAVTVGISVDTVADQADEIFIESFRVPTKTVSFNRAELITDEGRAAVERRILLAANAVCGPTDHNAARNLSGHAISRNKACQERAVDQAISQLDSGTIAYID